MNIIVNLKRAFNYQVKYLCKSVAQRERLRNHLKNGGYTDLGKKVYPVEWDYEMLYIVTKGTTFDILPSNRGTWEHRVPLDARSEGEFFELAGIEFPEPMFTQQDMKHFAEYCRMVSFDLDDCFNRKYNKEYGIIKNPATKEEQ